MPARLIDPVLAQLGLHQLTVTRSQKAAGCPAHSAQLWARRVPYSSSRNGERRSRLDRSGTGSGRGGGFGAGDSGAPRVNARPKSMASIRKVVHVGHAGAHE